MEDKSIQANSLCPSIRIAFNHKIPATFELKHRAIFDYELLYIGSGCAHTVINGSTHMAQTGDIVLFKPGIEHSFTLEANSNGPSSPPRIHLPHIHFDLISRPGNHKVYTSFKPLSSFTEEERNMISPDVLAKEGINLPAHIKLKDSNPAKNLLLRIISEKGKNTPWSDMKANGMLLSLLGIIHSSLSFTSPKQIDLHINKLEVAHAYIENNLSRPFNIEELAKASGLSKYYLARLFKEAFNEPPIATHRRLRIERGCELLLYTDMSVTKVSEELGFSSVHSFSRAFKTLKGTSPIQYIKFYQGNNH